MKILAIETSTRTGSVALLDDNVLKGELTLNPDSTHSANLIPTIDKLLKRTKVKLSDIDYFAISAGPGSFTGLRIGHAAVLGFAFANKKNVIQVSSLKVIASNVPLTDRIICPIITAGKTNVSFGFYKYTKDGKLKLTHKEKSTSIGEFLKLINENYIFVGDGAITHRDKIIKVLPNANILDEYYCIPKASNLALLAKDNLALGNFTSFSKLKNVVPNYLLKSYAEIQLSQKTQKLRMREITI